MLEVTAEAHDKLTEYFKENNLTSSLRIFLNHGGCSGPTLGLALDEAKAEDERFEQQDLQFLIEKNLLQQCGSITVDYINAGKQSGFSIRPSTPLPGAGGGCSAGSCGSGGCGC
ncbi:IscA/HesB family protein [Desulfopila aestuarii]|uniref:Iron-sulfur cluster assembly accessory protein n=1 Tax=Desulfopila aestuarii DSM 18488 TaxID=1121416 RepID=A0A1M7Y6Z4_9BACT|nr:IscA/HesB family protein [Desulfopila aestuarii]SHO48286.1 Iron-sulfur cluster assembly accessory protein [Desulfopila aestuarii DSM 18488]